ncbi:hypothetical protein DDI_2045 [Dickeya dianthicola RNS04.9]|nr:hypothetical protein DDI_2045 [Dickeya dianthicola RNS04.9]
MVFCWRQVIQGETETLAVNSFSLRSVISRTSFSVLNR